MIPTKRPLTSRPLPKSLSSNSLPSASLPKGALAARRAAQLPSDPQKRSKRRWAAVIAVLLLLCVGGAYAFFFRTSNREADGGRRFDPERMAQFMEREKQQDEHMMKVLAMAPADQIKALDQDIDKFMAEQKQRQDRFAERAKQRAANPDANNAPGDPNAKGGNNGGGGPGGPGGNGPGGGRGGRGARDPNQPNAWRNRMLSQTPAGQRAERTINRELRQVYQNMLQTQASQRGINLGNMGGGGFGGGGGGGFGGGGRGGRGG